MYTYWDLIPNFPLGGVFYFGMRQVLKYSQAEGLPGVVISGGPKSCLYEVQV